MKKVTSILLLVVFIISSVPVFAESSSMRAVWFSYEDYASNLAGLNEAEYREKADYICKNIKSSGFNTLIFHVRAFSDAFYDSSYFQYSRYVTSAAGVSPGYDPLSIMCEVAEKNAISLHAWINPYRIGSPKNVTESSVAYAWKNAYGNERVCDVNGMWYYNPASYEVREYIIEGVREIVQNYNIDGIHFDDYFYPTADESFDIEFYEKANTNLTLNQWRIQNVNDLVKKTYESIRAINPNVSFGISPNADIEKNYSQYFADVKTWCVEKGYVDYIVPQIYFGYKNSTTPFDKVLTQWSDMCVVPKLYIGIATYKSGKEDKWAGDGKNEWIESADICLRQIKDIEKNSKADGFMIFCYSPVFGENANESAKMELENIKAYLKNEPQSKIFKSFISMIKALFDME